MANHSVIDVLSKLISCESVTPIEGGAQTYIDEVLSPLGFDCHHVPFEEVSNLFARYGTSGPHLCYAGHTDVVPPGDLSQWTSPPFEPEIRDGYIYGRGAADMKGSVAAFMVAVQNFLQKHGPLKEGSISFLITGDEEGPAVNGTVKVLEWMRENGHNPDVALVGEPTNPSEMGQEMKVGRRGSLSGEIRVKGVQGHVAYPNLADNPLPPLISMLHDLAQYTFDEGTEFFAPTNLEITTIDVGNTATNVIPQTGRASFNVRFNDTWTAKTIEAKIREILDQTGAPYELECESNAECFLTEQGDWTNLVQQAVKDVTGRLPEMTTGGGTSDARFFPGYAPVIECGAVNESIHKIDENARVEDLECLVKIFERILERYFKL